MTVKVMTELVNVLSDDMPSFPVEQTIKAIWGQELYPLEGLVLPHQFPLY